MTPKRDLRRTVEDPGERVPRTLNEEDARAAVRDAIADLFHLHEGNEIDVLVTLLGEWEPSRRTYQGDLADDDAPVIVGE